MDIDFEQERSVALDTPDERPPLAVGAYIHALRKARRWTLVETSKRTGLSLSALSKIERDELSPTLTSLNKIATGFGIDVVTLLSGGGEERYSQGRRSISRHNQGLVHPTQTCENIWFAADLQHKRMLPLKTQVKARVPGDYAEWPVQAGEIFLYVLSGTLEVHSTLYAPISLQPGDSIYYDASSGHKWLSTSELDAEVLWVYAA